MAPGRQASIWTKSALHRFVQRELRGARLIVVSHREPYIHRRCEGGVECTRPAGGLTAALDPILKATGGVWVAHGSGDADRKVTGRDGGIRVPPESPRYRLRRVWVDRRTEKRFCGGLANQALWPLCHAAFHRP
jgi:trehalose 6-phosphate synthase